MTQSSPPSFGPPTVPALERLNKIGIATVFIGLLAPASIAVMLFPAAEQAYRDGHPLGYALDMLFMLLPAVFLLGCYALKAWHVPSKRQWRRLWRQTVHARYPHMVEFLSVIPRTQLMQSDLKILKDNLSGMFDREMVEERRPHAPLPRHLWQKQAETALRRITHTDYTPQQSFHLAYGHLEQALPHVPPAQNRPEAPLQTAHA